MEERELSADGHELRFAVNHLAGFALTQRLLGRSPISPLQEGVEATLRLVADPALEAVTGRFYEGLRETVPDAQAADAGARRRLWELSERLTRSAG